MNPNTKLSEQVALLAAINPVSSAAAVDSGWLNANECQQILGVVMVGVFGASGTVDAKFQQAKDSAGTGAKDVTGKAITQLAAGTNNVQAEVNLRGSDLDTEGGFYYVKFIITPAVAASLVAGAVLASSVYESAAATLNNTTVQQIV